MATLLLTQIFAWTGAVPEAFAGAPLRFADVIDVAGTSLSPFHGLPTERLAVLACGQGRCRPVPMQVDEVTPDGEWVLDWGPGPRSDVPPGIIDDNDHLLFMAEDAGDRVRRGDLPGRFPVIEIAVHDPLTERTRWAYAVAFAEPAPRSPTRHVEYDSAPDRVRGARVTLGFRNGVPSSLSLHDDRGEQELLDRFKVRATAYFFWGWLRFSRGEDDVTTEAVGWRAGPIRVIRANRHRVRIGWGIRSPVFGSYTYFHRDFARLPVSLRLNLPATFFFSDIDIRTVLDFRDLRGWGVLVPDLPGMLPVDGHMSALERDIASVQGPWFALLGPRLTLLQTMRSSPSLESMRRSLYYRDAETGGEAPQEFDGELPGVGYRMSRWDNVAAGEHWFEALSYALPVGIDVYDFLRARERPLQVTTAEAR